MAPRGKGYFFHQDTLERLDILEHAAHIHDYPGEFGLSPGDVAGLNPGAHRRELMELVWQRGWIRVRHHRGRCSFEFRSTWDAVRRFMPRLADEVGLGDLTDVCLYEHNTMTGFEDWLWKDLAELLEEPAEVISSRADRIVVEEE